MFPVLVLGTRWLGAQIPRAAVQNLGAAAQIPSSVSPIDANLKSSTSISMNSLFVNTNKVLFRGKVVTMTNRFWVASKWQVMRKFIRCFYFLAIWCVRHFDCDFCIYRFLVDSGSIDVLIINSVWCGALCIDVAFQICLNMLTTK